MVLDGIAPSNRGAPLVDAEQARKIIKDPGISSLSAASLSVLFILLYVVPFYLSSKTRPSPTLNRDAPHVIQARIRSVTVTIMTTSLLTLFLLRVVANLDFESSIHYLGLWPISLWSCLKPLSLTFALYLGPLYKDVVLDKSLSPISTVTGEILASLSSSMGYRNYVAGPVTEEILFRSCLIPIHLLSPMVSSNKHLVFLTPLYFAVAHVHHFYEFRLTHPNTAMIPAILRTLFQFAYTTIFGWYAAYIFLRTGNAYSVILIHAFCNYMGLPRLWGKIKLQNDSLRHLEPASRRSHAVYNDESESMPTSKLGQDRFSSAIDIFDPLAKSETFQTLLYYTLLFSGIYVFIDHIASWTNFPDSALVDFDKNWH